MTQHPLDGAWAKLERAKAHVDTITAGLPETPEQGVYALATRREYRADMGAVAVIAESVPELPDNLSLLIGDALHNFRSSLDLAWWQLTVKHPRANANRERVL